VQQFRSCLTGEELYRFIVHDHDAVFSAAVDDALSAMNLRALTHLRHFDPGKRARDPDFLTFSASRIGARVKCGVTKYPH
jgi:hypothetical protein